MSMLTWQPEAQVWRWDRRQTERAAALSPDGLAHGDVLEALFPDGPRDGISYSEGNSLTEAGVLNLSRVIVGHPEALPLATSSGGKVGALMGIGSDSTANHGSPLALGTLGPLAGEGPHLTWYQEQDPGFPYASRDGLLHGQVTVGPDDANFPWQEWGWAVCPPVLPGTAFSPYLHQAAEGALLLNRKAAYHGVKEQGRAWTLKVAIRVVA